ncbi:hypothetical protein H5410_013736 [Solanum commersonii]|uniref:Uncharacterized protein n=1 Tax=Solanum commersonii TaxID=4109 RepID=A0A9J5ZP18_SOLCO|nr:hypothetical protein H5410_013736 [Solanum commersonii]
MKNWARARAETGITIQSSIQIFPRTEELLLVQDFNRNPPKIRMTRSMWRCCEKAAGVPPAYDVELKIDAASGVFNAGQLLGSFEQRFGPGMGLKKWAGRTLESVGI